jgi:uncharacterized SAM-binding protein YcdF (DUF218 family)
MVIIAKYMIIFLLIFIVFVTFNLGKILNITENPKISDVVVCLGGGTIDRVKKSLSLIDKGFVKSNRLLLIGESWYNQPYLSKNRPNLDLDINEIPKNTAQEIITIKKYMIKNNLKTALIVTDPAHSARVNLLFSLLQVKDDDNLKITLISSNVSWWKEKKYYLDKRSRDATIYNVPSKKHQIKR